MTEYDATELAYKRGRANGIGEVIAAIDNILNIDSAHLYLADQFLISQHEYAKLKEKFLSEIEEIFKNKLGK